MSHIIATYLIETAHPLEKAAEVMAGEQSSGTFVKVPGETPELTEKHAAKVVDIKPLGTSDVPSLPGSRPPRGSAPRYQQAVVTIAYPFVNVGASLATLITTCSGNLYELSQFSGLKLLDVQIPDEFAAAYAGPQFGIGGTRHLAGVYNRPLIGTIIKPSVGFSARQTADLVKILCEAGIDFIKDDELQTNSPHNPLNERVKEVMRVINDHAQRSGKKVMYAFNITGDIEDMLWSHDTVLAHGGTCVMVNLLAVGLPGTAYLRKHSQLPIHGHRAGWGAMARHPLLGMEYIAYQKFARLAGADHLHVNGIRNKFCESDESVIANARECLTPMLGGYTVMPVFSSGQLAEQAPDTYNVLHSTDLIYLAGGGILAHPDGPTAGVQSLIEAWDAAIKQIPLSEYATAHPALATSLKAFNRP